MYRKYFIVLLLNIISIIKTKKKQRIRCGMRCYININIIMYKLKGFPVP